ncbi:AAA family ATPase [Patescibacteria group bacterium]|nr:AAA family ATPase [Patescibacteria group bacterium]
MNRNILLVTGVSASGKDYLLEQARRHDERIGTAVPIVSMGSAIVAKMRQQEVEESSLDRDRIKHIASNDVMRGIVKGIVAELVKYPAAIVNGHITYRQQGQLVSNPDVDAEISPTAYAVVVAEPRDIAAWRALDTGRVRETETIDQIAYHQDFTVQAAEKAAATLGAGFQLIKNNPENTLTSSLILATMVTEICPK